MKQLFWALFGLAIGLAAGSAPAATDAPETTLAVVKARGAVRCGVTDLGQALSQLDVNGRWVGFYAEFCRAVAAAVTGSADNVDFVQVSAADRFNVLRGGSIDLLSDASTWTLGRQTDHLVFAGTDFMDGQSFLTLRQANLTRMADLKGRKVCVRANSTSVENLRDESAARGLDIQIMEFTTIEGAYAAFFGRQCDAITNDSLVLASQRQFLAPNPQDYVLMSERISREPLGPVVRENDVRWQNVVEWTLHGLIAAEQLAITSANVDAMAKSGTKEAQRLLGTQPGLGAKLGLDETWAYRIVKQVGNYGEIFDRTLGAQLHVERGPNALVSKGGILWAPPVR
jgi:general L-amino acid transport system substrate-binding protein